MSSLNNVIGYKNLKDILAELNNKEYSPFINIKHLTTRLEREINRLEKK